MRYGPNTEEVEDFLSRLEKLEPQSWAEVSANWQRLMRPYPGAERLIDWNVLAAVAQAKDAMEMRRVLELLKPGTAATTPVPDEDQLLRMVASGERARQIARAGHADDAAVEAAAGVAGVLALRPWVADALAENVTAAFNDVWPDWPTTVETLPVEAD